MLMNTLKVLVNNSWVMLMIIFRILINNLVKKSFYRKIKKKVINVLTTFFISHKNYVKTFLKWIINQYPKGTR